MHRQERAKFEGGERREQDHVPVYGVYPSTGLDVRTEGLEGELGSEGIVGDIFLGVNTLDEGGDHAYVVVGGGCGDEHVVRVPGDVEHGRVVELDVLGYPPIVFLIEVADGDDLGARGNGKLVLARRPGAAGRGTVDSQQHQRGVPGVVLKTPHISITILRARQDAVLLVAPGQGGHNSVVLSEGLNEVELSARILVDLNGRIIRAKRKQATIRVPSVGGDGDGETVEVDSHGGSTSNDRLALSAPRRLSGDTHSLFPFYPSSSSRVPIT